MIKRTYFVTYGKGNGDGTNLIGSMTVTKTSWLPSPVSAFNYAVEFIKEKHGAVITEFRKI